MSNDRLLFDFDKKGWHEQYFSYTFTEDVYHIALRTVHKIIDNFPLADEKKINTKDTLNVFYSFQENARVSNLNYRDHLVHQFQVFLIGLKIMSSPWWYHYVIKNKDERNYAIPWAIAALFHDIGYPFEKLEGIKRKYIEKLLLLEGDQILADKVSQDILFGRMNDPSENKELLELFYEMIKDASSNLGINADEKERYYWFFKKLFVEERKHAITSAMYVYHTMLSGIKKLSNEKSEILSSILFHDKQVWIDAIKSKKLKITTLENIIKTLNTIDYKDDNVCSNCAKKYNKEKKIRSNSGEGKKFLVTLNEYFGKEWKNTINTNGAKYKDLWYFTLHRIFLKEPLLEKHAIKWKHKLNPKKNPLQFLLLLCDMLQERGREIGEDPLSNECFPDITLSNDPNNKNLIIQLEKPLDCYDDRAFILESILESMKIFVDLYLLKYLFDGNFYNVKYEDNHNIKITLSTGGIS